MSLLSNEHIVVRRAISKDDLSLDGDSFVRDRDPDDRKNDIAMWSLHMNFVSMNVSRW